MSIFHFSKSASEVKYKHSGNRMLGHKKGWICFNQSTDILCANRYKPINQIVTQELQLSTRTVAINRSALYLYLLLLSVGHISRTFYCPQSRCRRRRRRRHRRCQFDPGTVEGDLQCRSQTQSEPQAMTQEAQTLELKSSTAGWSWTPRLKTCLLYIPRRCVGRGRYRLRKPQAIDFTLLPSFLQSSVWRIVRHRNRFVVRSTSSSSLAA